MSFSIIPRKIYEVKSLVSGQIVVEEQLGAYSLSVQNLIQSGGLAKGIWVKALKNVQKFKCSNVQNSLILGLGGGTVAHLIKQTWPQVKITGIELDPEVIKIAKKYFHLGTMNGLTIINADAFAWLKQVSSPKFELIIVDLYLGSRFPPQAEKSDFFNQLKKILAQDGVIIFNRLNSQHSKAFQRHLAKHFFRIELVKTATNTFACCRRV